MEWKYYTMGEKFKQAFARRGQKKKPRRTLQTARRRPVFRQRQRLKTDRKRATVSEIAFQQREKRYFVVFVGIFSRAVPAFQNTKVMPYSVAFQRF